MAKDKDEAKAKDDDKKKAADKGAAAAEGEGDAATAPAKPKGRFAFLSFSRKTLMFVVAPAVLGVVVLGAGAYFFLFAGEEPKPVAAGEPGAAAHVEAAEHPTFVDVPEILVNLATTGDKPAYLKLSISLELQGGDEAAKALEPIMPRVVDQFQTYLRELRVEDLSGSAAMFRLKEELLRRVNMAVEPVMIRDVLFKEMIVQ